ncbi:hypothetical protein ACTA71_005394 [Dictyostelium dimigraforme]
MISSFKILSPTAAATTKTTTNQLKSINLINGIRYFSSEEDFFSKRTTPTGYKIIEKKEPLKEYPSFKKPEFRGEIIKGQKVFSEDLINPKREALYNNNNNNRNNYYNNNNRKNNNSRNRNKFDRESFYLNDFDSSKYISNKPEKRIFDLEGQAVYGINPVWVALSSENRTINALYVCGTLLPKLIELGIDIKNIENSRMEYISDFNHNYGREEIDEDEEYLNKKDEQEQEEDQEEEEEEEENKKKMTTTTTTTTTTFNRYSDRKNLTALKEIVKNSFKRKIPVRSVNKGTLDSFSKGRAHQGVILDASPLTLLNIDFLERFNINQRLSDKNENKLVGNRINKDKYPLWLVLDELWDPQNVGAIIRTCSFFNIDGIVISNKHSSPITPTASKSSSGACESFIIHRTESIEGFLKSSQRNGWNIIGTSLDDTNENRPCVDVNQVQLNQPTILILGNEGFGLKPSVLEVCNKTIKIIGGNYKIDSLNVSVTSGILIHTLLSSASLPIVNK